jgi:hypothetical protein
VAYLSKSLLETEQNYEIHNKEMLAIICPLEEWRLGLGRYKLGWCDLSIKKTKKHEKGSQKLGDFSNQRLFVCMYFTKGIPY